MGPRPAERFRDGCGQAGTGPVPMSARVDPPNPDWMRTVINEVGALAVRIEGGPGSAASAGAVWVHGGDGLGRAASLSQRLLCGGHVVE